MPAAQYTKPSYPITALQWTGSNADEVLTLIGPSFSVDFISGKLTLLTAEPIEISPSDWIIMDLKTSQVSAACDVRFQADYIPA